MYRICLVICCNIFRLQPVIKSNPQTSVQYSQPFVGILQLVVLATKHMLLGKASKHCTVFYESAYLWPNIKVDLVSNSLNVEGEQQMIIVVRELPPERMWDTKIILQGNKTEANLAREPIQIN